MPTTNERRTRVAGYQGDVNLAGPVQVLSEGYYAETFKEVYLRPAETRPLFEKRGWRTLAALQLRNPMHRSHECLAKIALEVCDGLLVHQLVGKLKPGDIPAEVRISAVNAVVEKYFVGPGRVSHGDAVRGSSRGATARSRATELWMQPPHRRP